MLKKKISSESLNITFLFTILLCLLAIYVHLLNGFLGYKGIYDSREPVISSYDEKTAWQIIIDLDQLSIFVYKDGILIRTYPCSGGKNETPSPTGDFEIVKKESWGKGFGGVWMGLNVPWGTFGIHGTNNPSVIGNKNVSGGCIRMLTEDAKELADMVPLKTRVRIVQKNKPFVTRFVGDRGSEVWNAQIILHCFGYYNGELDGMFGAQLREAIIKFQKDNGLKVTGSLNQKTYDKIFESLKTW